MFRVGFELVREDERRAPRCPCPDIMDGGTARTVDLKVRIALY